MNQFIKSIIISFSVFLTSSIFVFANAGHLPATATGYSVDELASAIMDIEDNTLGWDGAPFPALPQGCEMTRVVFARGIQSYKSDGATYNATGPLAELFDIEFVGDLEIGNTNPINVHEAAGDKIGTHYQHISKPAWEFPNGLRVIVESAFKIGAPGPSGIPGNLPVSAFDVKWLNVGLKNGSVKVEGAENKDKIKNKDVPNRLYRVLTFEGVPPVAIPLAGTTTGSGYTTFYVFLTCP